MDLRRSSTWPAIGIIAALYFLVGKAGLSLASLNASSSPVWPAAGLALAALMLMGYRVWPGIFVGAFLVNLLTAGNLATSLLIAAGNTMEALCAVYLVNRFADGLQAFDRPGGLLKFALIALVSSVVSASIGLTSLATFGYVPWQNYPAIWTTWWMGDTTGILLATPLLVLWNVAPTRQWTRRDLIEISSLFVLLIVVGVVVFSGSFPGSARNFPLTFLRAPIVIWMAFRFTPRETATGMLIYAAIAIWGTLHGNGPFLMDDENQSLLMLQVRTAVTAVTALALSAAMVERRRAEAAIEQQRALVEAANKTKDNFLAMLSHELRTPLTPVVAALDSLDPLAEQFEEAKAPLAMIRRNIELESQLIDDLLDLTRIARDKLKLEFQPLDAHECITNVAEICRMEADVRKLQVNLNLRAGAHFVSADSAKLQQIVWNLLKNAIKFTPENGEITVSSTNPSPQILEVTVTDTGIGIEQEVMKRIFDPFEQGDLSFQHRYGGLGLGLAISKSLANAHGGSLEAKSEGLNHGATFTFTIGTVSPPQRPLLAPAAAPKPASEQRSLRILLVDDHHDTCTALERLLVRRGHLVATTHDLRSAMETAARSQFDLVISDIALPDGTGVQLMTYLRAISKIRGIAISGFGMNGDIEKSLQAGFSEHLVKPVKIEKLEAAIERAIAG